MRTKRIICALLLAALMLALPTGALAAKKASVKLPAKFGLMLEGSDVTLTPKLKRIAADQLTWESSDESVLQVWGGRLTALKAGRAVVTVSGGGAKAKCGVVVLPVSVSLGIGETVSLPYGTVEKYTMKDKKVATVTKKGVITGVKAGNTSLQVKYGKQKVTIPVSVLSGASDDDDADDPWAEESRAAKLDAAGETDQIVLVEYTGGSKARLSVHENVSGTWTQLFETDAYVGKNGIGKTREGDKKTPVGTYNLNTPFGIKADPGAILPYTKVTKYHYWCGSSSSEYYNQLVDSRETGRSYTSSDEHLIDYKTVYNYCMFIDYNAEGKPGLGSCIFLHCKGSKKYTAGCVAISEASMKKIIQWARDGAKIVIKAA